jgi:Flp pilus assembly protein TadB
MIVTVTALALLVPGLMLLAISIPLGAIALVIGGLLLTPLAVFLFIFIAVFTLVLYTLAYREAARLTTATT